MLEANDDETTTPINDTIGGNNSLPQRLLAKVASPKKTAESTFA